MIRMMDLQITKKFSSSKIKGYRLNSHVRSVRMGKSFVQLGMVLCSFLGTWNFWGFALYQHKQFNLVLSK